MMKIILTKSEITAALISLVKSQLAIRDDVEVTVEIVAGIGDGNFEGVVALHNAPTAEKVQQAIPAWESPMLAPQQEAPELPKVVKIPEVKEAATAQTVHGFFPGLQKANQAEPAPTPEPKKEEAAAPTMIYAPPGGESPALFSPEQAPAAAPAAVSPPGVKSLFANMQRPNNNPNT